MKKHPLKSLLIIFTILAFTSNIYATVFSDTYDTSTPAGSDSPTEADDRMRETKAAVQERMNVCMFWPLTGTQVSDTHAGEFRFCLFHEPIDATPTVAENHGDLRIKDVAGKAELHWTDEDENEVQITSVGKLGSTSTNLAAKTITVNNADNNLLDLQSTDTRANILLYDDSTTGGLEEAINRTADILILSRSGGDNRLGTATSAATDTARQIADKGYVDSITDPSYSGAESHDFIGGLQIKTGTITAGPGTTGTHTFTPAFNNAVLTVFMMRNAVDSNSDCVVTAKTGKVSFNWRQAGGSSSAFDWVAIGN